MPRSFLVKKASSCSGANSGDEVTSTQCDTAGRRKRQHSNWPPEKNYTNVTLISPVISGGPFRSVVSGADHVTNPWLLRKHPDLRYWLENNVANLPAVANFRVEKDDFTIFCVRNGTGQQQQRRRPLSILFSSPAPSTISTTPSHRESPGTPWRPFTVHEDQPTMSTVAAANAAPHRELSGVRVDRTVQQHPALLGPASTPYCTPTAPFLQQRPPTVLPDSVYSHLLNQLHSQPRKSLCHQQEVIDSSLAVTAGISTALQQCEQSDGTSTVHRQSSGPSPSSGSGSGTGSPATRSPSPLLSCPHCDKTYTSSGALKMHVRTHTLPCRCSACGKAFSRPWLLQGHLRTHTGERPFSCTVCGRAFADRSNLRAHGQTHAVAKRYPCPGCRRSFSRLSLLLRHQRHSTSGSCRGRHSNDELDSTQVMSDDRYK